jgi:hypothetical protein
MAARVMNGTPFTRRDVLLALAACTVARAGGTQPAPTLPPFSTAPLGAAVPPGWQHETLPKVERPNRFEIVDDARARVLRVDSSASASSLVAPLVQPVVAARLRWRWKVARSLPGSDFSRKEGDDYAARLYVLFDLPVERLALGDRLRIQTARALSGREIPTAAICYVWGQAQPAGSSAPNPYTDRVRMIVLDSGDALAGSWREHARDLRRDWEASFPGPMPAVRAIAVGADTDNTGASTQTWFGDVQLGTAP